MRTRFSWRLLAAGLVLGLGTTACGTTGDDTDGGGGSGGAAAGPVTGLQVLVPNSPGSGYDTTARAAAKAMEGAGLARRVEVSNVSGAGGTVGLQKVVNDKGNEDLLMQMGLGVVGASFTNKSKATLQDTTPIARLIEEASAIVVPAASPYQDVDALVEAWKKEPGRVAVGGGSSPGGPDHLAPMLLAKAVGVTPKDVNYVSYDGGGELLAALLGNKIAFGSTGIGEITEDAKAGKVRVLAVTSDKPVDGLDAPTLADSGIDLTFTNWRGLVAAPGISDERRQELVDLVTRLHKSKQWQDTLADQGWTDAFITGEEFGSFLKEENDRVAGVLGELGLA